MPAKKKTAAAPEATAWPIDQTERVPLKKLIPYARNARKHSPEQVAQIRASMREFGWTMPVLIDEDGGILAGHGRVMAAEAEVLAGDKRFASVPSIRAVGWSDAKKRAYILADNKLSLNASWDEKLLRDELQALIDGGYDIGLTGFNEAEFAQLFNEDGGSTNPAGEWDGMPEFEQEASGAYRSIQVHFADPKAVKAFAKLIKQAFSEKAKFIWHPALIRTKVADKEYVDAE